MAKKRGNANVGGDKKTNERRKARNPRGKKKGGRVSRERGLMTRTCVCMTRGNCTKAHRPGSLKKLPGRIVYTNGKTQAVAKW